MHKWEAPISMLACSKASKAQQNVGYKQEKKHRIEYTIRKASGLVRCY